MSTRLSMLDARDRERETEIERLRESEIDRDNEMRHMI